MDEQRNPELSINNLSSQGSYIGGQRRRSKKKVVIALVIFLLLVGGVFGGSKFLGTKEDVKGEKAPTPSPTDIIFPTDTPSPSPTEEPTPTEKAKSTATPRPTQNPKDSASGLDRSELTVEVQNGSGEKGVASGGSEVLKVFGYSVVGIGNADNFEYQGTTILIKSSDVKFLPLLKNDVSKQYTVSSTSATLSASSSADAVVIIGK